RLETSAEFTGSALETYGTKLKNGVKKLLGEDPECVRIFDQASLDWLYTGRWTLPLGKSIPLEPDVVSEFNYHYFLDIVRSKAGDQRLGWRKETIEWSRIRPRIERGKDGDSSISKTVLVGRAIATNDEGEHFNFHFSRLDDHHLGISAVATGKHR